MNKYTYPLTIRFKANPELLYEDQTNTLNLDPSLSWTDFNHHVTDTIPQIPHDYIMIAIDPDLSMDDHLLKNLDFRTNHIARQANNRGVNTYAFRRENKTFYQLNNTYQSAKPYAPADSLVIKKAAQYGFDIRDPQSSNIQWQEHQDQIMNKLKTMMPLVKKKDAFNPYNHQAELTAAKRGLEPQDLKDFFSWKSNKVLNPNLLDDDLIGMPGIRGSISEDEFYYNNKLIANKSLQVQTTGLEGYAIPMKTAQGNYTKFQCGTDPSTFNIKLKARAKDGISIQNSEIYDKKMDEFTFTDHKGQPMHLHISKVEGNTVTFSDRDGTFTTPLKQDILPHLDMRGYEIPDMIASLKSDVKAKYIWTSPGNFIGSKEIQKQISPSEAGFIEVAKPRGDQDRYTVLVVEGALKGQIVAKYATHGGDQSLYQTIAGRDGHGLIVAQVPGVAKAFTESVNKIHDAYPVDQIVIAMDADGRENLSVARGIHDTYQCLSRPGVKLAVMSWNPEQKGLDDALLALSRQEITKDDLHLTFGTPEKLFPLNQATAPNPYRLDGTKANKEAWRIEDDEAQIVRAKKLAKAQANAKEVEQLSLADQPQSDAQFDFEKIQTSLDTLLTAKDNFKSIAKSRPEMKTSLEELQLSLANSLKELDELNDLNFHQ